MLIRSTQEKYHYIGVLDMANKSRTSVRSGRGGNQNKVESDLPMDVQEQSAEVPANAQHQEEEDRVHKDNGQEPIQPEEQEMVQEVVDSPKVADDDLVEEPAIHEEQEIIPGQVQEEQQQAIVEQLKTAISDMNSQVAQQEQDEGKIEQVITIEDIVKPGKFGVTNSQMIPAIKQAISDGSVEKLRMLRLIYLYSFENSLKYLKKAEREFIRNTLK
jgi:hypothetical protein